MRCLDVESNPLEKIGAIGVRLVMAEVAYNRVTRSIPNWMNLTR